MGWEDIVTDWAIGELVHADSDIQRWENNMQFLFENLHYLKIGGATSPQSGIDAPAIESVESSTADTYKPTWLQARFDGSSDEALMWEFTSWFDSDTMTGIKIPYTMDTNNSSANIVFNIQVACVSDGDGSYTAKAFDTDNSTQVSVPDNENTLDVASCPITNWDSITYGDVCRIIVAVTPTSSDHDATGEILMQDRLRFYK